MTTSNSRDAYVTHAELFRPRMIASVLVALGAVWSIVSYFVDSQRFAFSSLVGFSFIVTLGLGALFFILLQHTTGAVWSLAPRRHMEWISALLLASLFLFVPVAVGAPEIWHAWMTPESADPLLTAKAVWLNRPFFLLRSLVYLVVWAALSTWLWRRSRAHDINGEQRELDRLGRVSPPALVVFGVTITFAAFDWLMSLDPFWYSTIFGVYVFAGCVTSSLALVALVSSALEKRGKLGPIFNVEHRHDIGKLLFAFTVFWAYIAFSQYLLIWYANIPEETEFYRHRLQGDWRWMSIALIVGHFLVPFVLLLSRDVKRHRVGLAIGAVLLLFMHGLDLYWLIMPVFDTHGEHLSFLDLGAFLLPVGLGTSFVLHRASGSAAYPIRHPQLAEAALLENP